MMTTVKVVEKEIVIKRNNNSGFQSTRHEKRKQDDRITALPQRIIETVNAFGGIATLPTILQDFGSRHSDYIQRQPLTWRKRVEKTVPMVCTSVGNVGGDDIWKPRQDNNHVKDGLDWKKSERPTKIQKIKYHVTRKYIDPEDHTRDRSLEDRREKTSHEVAKPKKQTREDRKQSPKRKIGSSETVPKRTKSKWTKLNMQPFVEEALSAKGGIATSQEVRDYLVEHYSQELEFWTDWKSTLRHLLPRKFNVTRIPSSRSKLYSLPKLPEAAPDFTPSKNKVYSPPKTTESPPQRTTILPKKKRPFAVKSTIPPAKNSDTLKETNGPTFVPLGNPKTTYSQIIKEALGFYQGKATAAQIWHYAELWYPKKLRKKIRWQGCISAVLSQEFSKVGLTQEKKIVWGLKDDTSLSDRNDDQFIDLSSDNSTSLSDRNRLPVTYDEISSEDDGDETESDDEFSASDISSDDEY